MKLRVVSRYQAGSVAYQPGQELIVSEPEGRRLLADSPGSFEIVGEAPEAPHFEAPEAPPADKMIRGRKGNRP